MRSTNRRVMVVVGPQGTGYTEVPYAPGEIELVRCRGPHGTPHVLNTEVPDRALIEVLGAIPDTEVTVDFYTED